MSVLTAGAPSRQALRYQLDSGVRGLTPVERAAHGKEARAEAAWSDAEPPSRQRSSSPTLVRSLKTSRPEQ